MRKKDDKLINYFLYIGYILILVIVISMFVLTSKIVFSNSTTLGHVIETKNLLEDIEETQKVAEKNIEKNNNLTVDLYERKYNFNDFPSQIVDFSYLNINENKTFITLHITDNIKEREGVYYFSNKSLIERRDKIAYLKEFQIYIGEFISQKDNTYNIKSKDAIEKVPQINVLGKILYIKND